MESDGATPPLRTHDNLAQFWQVVFEAIIEQTGVLNHDGETFGAYLARAYQMPLADVERFCRMIGEGRTIEEAEAAIQQ
jgi:hypothetical protein